jgi:hypothetical protein
VQAFPAGLRAKNPPPVETISSFTVDTEPSGLWVDKRGILYVASGRSVLEFKPGSTKPFRTIAAFGPETVAVDARGTLYVDNDDGGNALVGVYPPGSMKPSRTITLSEGSIKASAGEMTFDSSGNLYVTAFFYRKGGFVFECAAGSSKCTDLGLPTAGGDGLGMDSSGNLYVGDQGTISVYAPGQKTPFREISGVSQQPVYFAVTRSGALYVPITGNESPNSFLEEFAPGASTPTNVLSGHFEEPVGAALQAEAF